MRSFVALAVVLLAASTSATPVYSINMKKLNRIGSYPNGVGQADRNRAAFLESGASGGQTVPVTNLGYQIYAAIVGVGSPPTYYNLIVDTGSSNTFVG